MADKNAGKSYHSGLIPIAHYPYITIVLDNGVSFTQNPSDGRPDYFVSLEHTRYTSQANTMRINITYVPTGKASPNTLEAAIRQSQGLFKFQYGSSKGVNMSPIFRGMMYDYSVSISEGCLTYSISAVSCSIIANYDNLRNNVNGINCEVDHIDSVDDVLNKMEAVVKNSDLNKYCIFDKENSAKTFKVTKSVPLSNKTPMNYLMEVAGTLSDVEDKENHYYKIVVSDVDDGTTHKCKIKLIRTGTAQVGKYVFQWGGKNTDIISWNPEYQGAYTIFGNNAEYSYVNVLTEDEGGSATAAQIMSFDARTMKDSAVSQLSSTSSVSLTESATLASTEIQEFKEKVRYPYRATLNVLGIGGDELVLGYSMINVSPYINGELHHTAGDYVVVGVKDTVNSSTGFTTTLSLYRYVKVESATDDTDDTNKVNPDGTVKTPDPVTGIRKDNKPNNTTTNREFISPLNNKNKNSNIWGLGG